MGGRLLMFFRRHWFKAVLAAVIIYVIFHFEELGRVFVGVSWLFVLLALLANLFSIMLKVASWKIIFDFSFRNTRGRWIDLTSALMIGFLVNALVPARLGELARAYVITRRQTRLGRPVSRSTVIGTIVLERVFDGVAMGLIVIAGIVRLELPAWAETGAASLLGICLLTAIVLIILEAKRERLKHSAREAMDRHGEGHSWFKRQGVRMHGALARFSDGQKTLRSPLRVIVLLFTTLSSWIAQLLAIWCSLMAFHLGGELGITGALLLLILINIAGALPATPGNIGVFQLATVIPMMRVYGIGEHEALAFSIGLQAIEGSIGLGIGSAFLFREHLTLKEVKSESLSIEKEEMDEAEG